MAEGLQKVGEPKSNGDLSITALYTAQTWAWADFEGSDIFVSDQSRAVFGVTNLFLGIARLFNWRLRSLRISLVHRHALIDRLVERLGPDFVLEVGAGLSRRGYAMSKDPRLAYQEVDTPPVVAQKRALLRAAEPDLERPNWTIEEGDALKLDYGSLVHASHRPVVVAEGLLMYLQADEQRHLWTTIAEAFKTKSEGAFIFDLVPQCEQPKPGIFGNFLGWLMKRFTGGQTFVRDERDRAAIERELLEAGFGRVEMIEPAQKAETYGLPYPSYQSEQLIFACMPAQGDAPKSVDPE